MKILALSLLILASPSYGAEWKTRSDDILFSQAQLTTRVRGKVLTYFDGGTSDFRKNGQYFYTYGGGGVWEGHYDIGGDSTICITYVTAQTRCDLYVSSGKRLTVITETGMRFPIKAITEN